MECWHIIPTLSLLCKIFSILNTYFFLSSEAGYGQTNADYGQTKAGYGQTKAGYGHTKAGYGQNKADYGQTKANFCYTTTRKLKLGCQRQKLDFKFKKNYPSMNESTPIEYSFTRITSRAKSLF